MADDDGTSDDVTTDPVKGKDKKSKQQRMLIVIGVIGLLLTYFLLRRSSSGSATATTGTDQALAQYEQQNAASLSGLQSELQSLQGQVSGINPVMGSGDGQPGSPTSTPAQPSLYGTWGGGSGMFNPVSSGQVLPNYTTLFYSPASGVFDPVAPGDLSSLPANTQLYDFTDPNQPFGLQQWGTGGKSTGLIVPAA